MLPQVLSYIRQHRLILPGPPVIVAVSGGPDSLALLHTLLLLRGELGCDLHVAHLDHQLRGEQSAAEARFVAETARSWGLSCTVESADVAGLARARGQNLYAAGRAARYALLARLARERAAQAVAVGHTADDQAETVLAHLLRGAGADGLSGMRPSTAWEAWADASPAGPLAAHGGPGGPRLIRPLLSTARGAVEEYCRLQGLEPRRDPSNADTRHTRSRIRHDLLPRLIAYNPHIIEALCRTAETLAAERDLLAELLDASWPRLARVRPAGVDLRQAVWAELHPALQRLAIRRAYRLAGGAQTLGLGDVERAREAAGRASGRSVDLPGGIALSSGAGWLILGAPAEAAGPQLLDESADLPVPGELELAGGWLIRASYAGQAAEPGAWVVRLDAGRAAGGLRVRRRRPGDRMRPAGGAGSRRVQDLMVDAKLPRALRAAWPLLTSGDEIVWVPGGRAAEGWLAAWEARAIVVQVIGPETQE